MAGDLNSKTIIDIFHEQELQKTKKEKIKLISYIILSGHFAKPYR